MIAVQSMDGKIQIFEQSANAFTRQIADCLVPGCLSYWPKIDAFITTNHANHIECYKYQVLASSQGEMGRSQPHGQGAKGGQGEEEEDSDSTVRNSTTGMFHVSAVRSAMVEWTFHAGESCRQVLDGHFSGMESVKGGNVLSNELLVLCDQCLYLLKESGSLLQQRRLEVDPSCICVFKPTSTSGHNFILANQDKTIQIFSDFNLVWAAKVSSVPVQMSVNAFGGKKGLIVTVDDSGMLQISYIGTKPPANSVATNVNKRDVDYDKVDEEHRMLLQIIRDSQTDNKTEPRDKLLIRAQIPRTLDLEPMHGIDVRGDDFKLPNDLAFLGSSTDILNDSKNLVKICVRIYVSYSGAEPLNNVSLVAVVPNSVYICPQNVLIQKVSGVQSTPILTKFYIYCSKSSLPSVLDSACCFYATYTSPNGEPRSASTSIHLPLCLFCQPKPPSKTAAFKVILDTEAKPIPLTDLFEDYLFSIQETGVIDVRDAVGSTAAQAIGLQFYSTHSIDIDKYLTLKSTYNSSSTGNNNTSNTNGNDNSGSKPAASSSSSVAMDRDMDACINPNPHITSLVSIISSKTNGRYKIQSDSLPAMYIVAYELEKRLNLRIKDLNTSPNPNPSPAVGFVKCSDKYPLEEFFAAIDVHFNTRLLLVEQLSQLNDRAHQFRMIQKRLLVRYKEKNPTALGGIDVIMRESYDAIMVLSDSVEKNQARLKTFSVDVFGIAKFVVLLAGIKCDLDSKERKLLEQYFCLDCADGLEQGWEETVDASLTYLLKTSLAKNVKESTTLNNSSLEMPASTEALKKHISMVLDRLGKGAKLTTTVTISTANNNNNNNNNSNNNGNNSNSQSAALPGNLAL